MRRRRYSIIDSEDEDNIFEMSFRVFDMLIDKH